MRGTRLRRDITTVLVLKLVLLSGLYLLFFRGDQRPAIDVQVAARHLHSAETPR